MDHKLSGLCCNQTGDILVASGEQSISIMEKKKGNEWIFFKKIKELKGNIKKVVFTSKDQYLVSLSQSGIFIRETKNYLVIKEILNEKFCSNQLDAFQNSNYFIVTDSQDNSLILIRNSTEQIGKIVWKSSHLANKSLCVKIFEEKRQILIGNTQGECSILIY